MNNIETDTNRQSASKKMIFKNILNMELFLSVFVPVILFAVFSHYNMKLLGTIAAGGWSIVIVFVQYIRKNEFNIFAAIGAVFSGIGLIGTILAQDPTFYLVSPIVFHTILAMVFFGSVLIRKPIVLKLAEQATKGGFPEELRKHPKFNSAWNILSVAWGVLCLSQMLLGLILYFAVSNEIYYAISSFYGSISTVLMIIFSFGFPRWYWKKTK